ncbi:hypothetical protein BGZ88_006791, partial [Linnemannia elongata]
MLTQVAPNVTEFWIDTGASDSLYLTSCDTLVMKDGKATVKTGGSCLRLLPSLCSNVNVSGKVTVQTSLGRVTGARDAMGFRFQGIRYAQAPVGSLRFAAPVPVTTNLHGGSFTTGTGSDPAFNPANMASRGQVVVVTINYRLGLL